MWFFFLVNDSLLACFENFSLWITMDTCSYHHPIWLPIEGNDTCKHIPHKFNHEWIQEEDIKYFA